MHLGLYDLVATDVPLECDILSISMFLLFSVHGLTSWVHDTKLLFPVFQLFLS